MLIAIQKFPDVKSNMIQFVKDNANEIGDVLEILPRVSTLARSSNNPKGCGGCVDIIHSNKQVDFYDYNFPGSAANIKPYLLIMIFHSVGSISKDTSVVTSIFGIHPKVNSNLEERACMKMDSLGIRKYFTAPNFGGFGSDHDDQGYLVKIATECANKLFPGEFRLCVHVGDAPNDIQVAKFRGAPPIGVCTSVFKKEDLEKACSNRLFDNLTNSQKF